jgi:hypothetical protein
MSATDVKPFGVLLGILDRVDQRSEPDLLATEHQPDPWENSMQATCECLSWRETLDNLERRHAEDRLGESVYRQFPVRSRSAVVVAHELMGKGVISEDELQAKMNDVRARLEMAGREWAIFPGSDPGCGQPGRLRAP